MAIGHWIGGALGAFAFGPLGAIAGAVLGGVVQKAFINDENFEQWKDPEESPFADDSEERGSERTGFLFTFLVLSSYVIQADGRIMHSEMELLRRMLRQTFGQAAVSEGGEIIMRLFEHRKTTIDKQGRAAYEQLIAESCVQVRQHMSQAARLQLVAFLFELAKADGRVDESEVIAIRQVAAAIGLNTQEIDSLFSMGQNGLEAAYRVLEISPNATDEEVKKAYKRLALKYHPDRVATLGDDVRRAAEQKFQELGAAKERIYKARGL